MVTSDWFFYRFSGHFGQVYIGQLNIVDRKVLKTVAIKTLKGTPSLIHFKITRLDGRALWITVLLDKFRYPVQNIPLSHRKNIRPLIL